MSRRNKRNRSGLPFLAQLLFHSIGEFSTPCQGVVHQRQEQPARAEWEMRAYQDANLVLDLASKGVPREQINQKAWDAACKEQDTIGIVNHKTMFLCSDCARVITSNHAGETQATFAMITAVVTGTSFLLVSDRDSEDAGIITNLAYEVQEEGLRERLQQVNLVDIHFK